VAGRRPAKGGFGLDLADLTWRETSVHAVVAEFVRGEWRRHPRLAAAEVTPLVEGIDLGNPAHNHARLRLLHLMRAQLWAEIPPDTVWYEVTALTGQALAHIRVIARCGWDHPAHRNELAAVAARLPEPLLQPPASWPRPILWGHARSGPLTIIEGNHRLLGYASQARPAGLHLQALVGLSPTPCCWHLDDPAMAIANDLWK
jgi:hypothetical protein